MDAHVAGPLGKLGHAPGGGFVKRKILALGLD
jgi:hypothetical protein